MIRNPVLRIAIVGMYPSHANQIFEGIMRVTASLADALAILPETEVTVLTPHRMRHFLKKTTVQKKDHLIIKRMNYLTYIFHLLKNNLYDVVNIHGVSLFTALALIYQIRNRQNRNTVYTSHGLVAMEKQMGYRYSPSMVLFEKLLIYFSHSITTISSRTGQYILQNYNIQQKKITVIGNGVNPDLFKPAGRVKKKENSGQILFVGSLLPVKGLDFLFSVLYDIQDPFIMHLVGKSTPYFESLKTKYQALFHQKKIRFHGAKFQNELMKMYAFCDFLVLTSYYDQFPQVVLEAMAMGKPVLLSDRIGSSDIIQQGKNGYIIPYGDQNALKEKISDLLRHPLKCRKMGQFSRRVAEKNTWHNIAVQYRQFFPSLHRIKNS